MLRFLPIVLLSIVKKAAAPIMLNNMLILFQACPDNFMTLENILN